MKIIYAILLTIAGVVLNFLLWPWIAPNTFVLFLGTVLSSFSARFWGWLISCALSVSFASVFLLDFSEPSNIFRMILYVVTSYIIYFVYLRTQLLKTKLSETENRYQIMATAATDVIITCDDKNIIQFVNPAVKKMLGWEPDDMIGLSLTTIMPDSLRVKHKEGFNRYVRTGEKKVNWNGITMPVKRKDGTIFQGEISFGEYKQEGKRFFTGVIRDITERVKIENELAESLEKFKAQFKGSPIPIFSWKKINGDFFLSDFNDAGMEMTDGKIELMVGEKASEVYKNNPEVIKLIHRAYNEKTIVKQEGPFRLLTTGELKFLSASFVYLAPDTVMVHTEDITERMWLEEQKQKALENLKLAKEQAEGANKAKDEFLAVLSHELKTPLSSILGYSTLLSSGKLDDKPEAFKMAVSTIERSARVQVELIEDLLDISRIVAGKIEVKKLIVGIPGIVQQACSIAAPLIAEKQQLLECSEVKDKLFVMGDPGRLQQVLGNLLHNAVKFTPKGGRITVKIVPKELNVSISIKDTGIGIKREFLPHLFNRFSQESAGLRRRGGGLGLGLSIAKTLVDLHGGTIVGESDGEGKGALFTVTLPLSSPPLEEPVVKTFEAHRETTTLEGKKVLVVDDDNDTLEMLNVALTKFGAEVVTAESAEEARHKLDQNGIDLIVSDIGMYSEDGYTFMRTLRETGNKIPSLALTAFSGEQYSKHALDSGFNTFLSKPVDLLELVDALGAL